MKIQLASIIILSWIDRIPAFKYLYGVKNQSNSPSAIQVVIIYSKVFDGLEIWGGNQRLSLQGVIKLKTKMPGHIFNKTLGLTECFLGIWSFFGSFRLFKAFKKFADIRNSQFYRYVPFQHIYKVDIISGGFTNFLTEFEWAKSLKKGQIISINYF